MNQLVQNSDWYQNKVYSAKRGWGMLAYYVIGHILVIPIVFYVALLMAYDEATATLYAQAVSDSFNLLFMLMLFLPLLQDSFERIKGKVVYTVLHSIKWYVPLVLCNAGVSMIIQMTTNLTESNNQAMVEQMFKQSILSIAIPSLLVAPIVEELVFRGIIFRSLRKHGFWLASLASCLSFGLLHVVTSLFTGDFTDLIFVLPYAIMGFFFCLAYEKTKNIYGCIILHVLNNTIAMLAMVFML